MDPFTDLPIAIIGLAVLIGGAAAVAAVVNAYDTSGKRFSTRKQCGYFVVTCTCMGLALFALPYLF